MPDRADMSLHRLESVSNGVALVADMVRVRAEMEGGEEQTRGRVSVAREAEGRLTTKARLVASARKVIG